MCYHHKYEKTLKINLSKNLYFVLSLQTGFLFTQVYVKYFKVELKFESI